jgi:hypothetical protein
VVVVQVFRLAPQLRLIPAAPVVAAAVLTPAVTQAALLGLQDRVMLAGSGKAALLTLAYRPVAVAVAQAVRVRVALVVAATAAQALTPL